MLERFQKPLRIACMILAALVVFKASRLALQKNPLDHLRIPELPTLATNAVEQANPGGTTIAATNVVTPVKVTNATTVATTNVALTNAVAGTVVTNGSTNLPPITSNAVASAEVKGTNSPSPKPPQAAAPPSRVPPMMSAGVPPGGKKQPTLPPAIEARVKKITDSEILAQVVRPAPMALFGIAGDSAFIRSPAGQTGVIKEGEELGGIKLLKIGFNRVLIEHEGEKKELMIFAGFGGETLLPKDNKETPK